MWGEVGGLIGPIFHGEVGTQLRWRGLSGSSHNFRREWGIGSIRSTLFKFIVSRRQRRSMWPGSEVREGANPTKRARRTHCSSRLHR